MPEVPWDALDLRRAALRNGVASALGEREHDELLCHSCLVQISAKTILFRPDDDLEHVYFPVSGLTSISVVIGTHVTPDIIMIGRGGVVGAEVAIGQTVATYTAVQRVSGAALKVGTGDLCRLLNRHDGIRRAMLKCLGSNYWEASQAAACNARHSVRQRLARCLLSVSDEVGESSVSLTHETLSAMLGVRRVGVTRAASALDEAGAVQQRWGQIRIADRGLLERSACGCQRAGVPPLQCASAGKPVPAPEQSVPGDAARLEPAVADLP